MTMRSETPSICAAILHWKGKEHLENLLPTAIGAAENYGGSIDLVILDNGAGQADNDTSWIRKNYPDVNYIASPENDFLYSYNWLAQRTSAEIFVLLNNDLRLFPEFFTQIARHFVDPSIFAVGGKSLSWDGSEETAEAFRLKRHHGKFFFQSYKPGENPSPTSLAVGGFSAFNRQKFVEIGGFDRLYHPGYFEDADLCLRALDKGWKVLYDSKAVVYHLENASFGKGTQTHFLMQRNECLFHLRHCSLKNKIGYLGVATVESLREMLKGDFTGTRSRLAAIPRAFAALKKPPASDGRDSLQALFDCKSNET